MTQNEEAVHIESWGYEVHMVELNGYLDIFMGSDVGPKNCGVELNEILLHSIPNFWGEKYFIQVFILRLSDALSGFPNYGNQNTTHESNYLTKNAPRVFDINEIPEGAFLITLNIIDQYKWKNPGLTEKKIKSVKYKITYFSGAGNAILGIMMCENKISIPQKLQNM